MSEDRNPRRAPSLSARVAAAEADIAETRRRLDGAISDIRHELALPLAAASRVASALDGTGDVKQLGDFVRRHAAPLGLIALGAAWLAVRCRGALGDTGAGFAHELLDRVRVLGGRAMERALSAAAAELSRPDRAAPDAAAQAPTPATEESPPD